MLMFFPSTQPRSRRPSRNACSQGTISEAENPDRNPIRRTFAGACAGPAPAQASAPAPSTTSNSRRVVMWRLRVPRGFLLELLDEQFADLDRPPVVLNAEPSFRESAVPGADGDDAV